MNSMNNNRNGQQRRANNRPPRARRPQLADPPTAAELRLRGGNSKKMAAVYASAVRQREAEDAELIEALRELSMETLTW